MVGIGVCQAKIKFSGFLDIGFEQFVRRRNLRPKNYFQYSRYLWISEMYLFVSKRNQLTILKEKTLICTFSFELHIFVRIKQDSLIIRAKWRKAYKFDITFSLALVCFDKSNGIKVMLTHEEYFL